MAILGPKTLFLAILACFGLFLAILTQVRTLGPKMTLRGSKNTIFRVLGLKKLQNRAPQELRSISNTRNGETVPKRSDSEAPFLGSFCERSDRHQKVSSKKRESKTAVRKLWSTDIELSAKQAH